MSKNKRHDYIKRLRLERSSLVGRLVSARSATDELAIHRLAHLQREVSRINDQLKSLGAS